MAAFSAAVLIDAFRTVPRAGFAAAQDDIARERLRTHCVLFNIDRDLRRMQQRVMDQAVVDGPLHPGAVLVWQIEGCFDLNANVIDSRDWILHFICAHAHVRALRR